MVDASSRILRVLFGPVPENHRIHAIAAIDAAPPPLLLLTEAFTADEPGTAETGHLFFLLAQLQCRLGADQFVK
jgi:hypothetical protein